MKAAVLCSSPRSHYSWDRLRLPIAFDLSTYLLQQLLERGEMGREHLTPWKGHAWEVTEHEDSWESQPHRRERWGGLWVPKATPSSCLALLSVCELVSSVHGDDHAGLAQQHLHYKKAAALGRPAAVLWAKVQRDGVAEPRGVPSAADPHQASPLRSAHWVSQKGAPGLPSAAPRRGMFYFSMVCRDL